MDITVNLCACWQEFVATLLNRVFEAGFCSNQASVKYLLEWMMILILFYYPQHVDKFWACFSMVRFHSGHQPVSTCVAHEPQRSLCPACCFVFSVAKEK